MKQFLKWIPVLMVVLGVAVTAQTKITTLEEHAKLMKSNGQASGAMGKAIGSATYADARMQVTTLRQNFMTLQTFWTEKKTPEAVTIVKDGLTRLDALDKMLAAPTVDQMAAQAAAKEFQGATCGACHKAFREGDAATGFKIKGGVL